MLAMPMTNYPKCFAYNVIRSLGERLKRYSIIGTFNRTLRERKPSSSVDSTRSQTCLISWVFLFINSALEYSINPHVHVVNVSGLHARAKCS